jgi:hypothetical protein
MEVIGFRNRKYRLRVSFRRKRVRRYQYKARELLVDMADANFCYFIGRAKLG